MNHSKKVLMLAAICAAFVISCTKTEVEKRCFSCINYTIKNKTGFGSHMGKSEVVCGHTAASITKYMEDSKREWSDSEYTYSYYTECKEKKQ